MNMCKATLGEEMEALYKYKTWELVELPKDRNVVRNKWACKIKHGDNDQV